MVLVFGIGIYNRNLPEKEKTVYPLNTYKNAVNPPISCMIMILVQRAKLCPLYSKIDFKILIFENIFLTTPNYVDGELND